MVQQLVHTIIISLLCIIWGIPVLLIFSKTIKESDFWYHSGTGLLAFLFLSGCIVLSLLGSWVVLFVPLRFYMWLVLTFILLIYLVAFKRNVIAGIFTHPSKSGTAFSPAENFYLILSLLLFLILGSIKAINNDTQIYHLQVIKWISEYGTVPGVVNLSPRFGLGSNWFNLISIFYVPFFKNENYSYLNIAFVSWFFLWLLHQYKHHSGKKEPYNSTLTAFYFFLSVYFMLDWQLFRDAANSTNYDFAVTAFTVIAIAYLMEEIMKKKSRESFSPFFILVCITVIALKFSGIFILFLAACYILILQKKKFAYFLFTIATGCIVLFPVLIKNYIITGYPLYPYPLSLFQPDWQLPKELTQGIYRYILNSNRYYNHPFSSAPMPASPFYWVPLWFEGIQIQHKIIFSGSLIAVCFLFFAKPVHGINYKAFRWLIFFLSLMIAGWFFTAPDPARFGYGILLPVTLFAFAVVSNTWLKPAYYKIILLCLGITMIPYIYIKVSPLKNEPKYFLQPIEPDKPPYRTYYLKGITLHLPQIINANWNCRCYDIVLPCTCDENPYIQPRGKNLKDGFRMSPYPDSLFIKNYIY